MTTSLSSILYIVRIGAANAAACVENILEVGPQWRPVNLATGADRRRLVPSEPLRNQIDMLRPSIAVGFPILRLSRLVLYSGEAVGDVVPYELTLRLAGLACEALEGLCLFALKVAWRPNACMKFATAQMLSENGRLAAALRLYDDQ